MYDDLSDELKSVIRTGAAGFAERYGKPAPPSTRMIKAQVAKVNADGTLDLSYQGAELMGVAATTACAGAMPGDTVVCESFQAQLIATGVIAKETVRIKGITSSDLTGKRTIYLTVRNGLAIVDISLNITRQINEWDEPIVCNGLPKPMLGVVESAAACQNSYKPCLFKVNGNGALILRGVGGRKFNAGDWLFGQVVYQTV